MKFLSFGRRARRKRGSRYHSGGRLGFRSHSIEPLEQRTLLSAVPVFDATLPDDLEVYAGAPLNVALRATDGDGDALTYEVSEVSNPELVNDAYVTGGNQSLRLTVVDFGAMEFQLFQQAVPDVTGRIGELVEQGYYSGKIFHRVISDFMIQGGSSDGIGSAGSGVKFDDQFHPHLQHTSSGILAMAKTSSDDSNDSQLYITARATRNLDFQHSVFGFLTAGDDVRDAIANTPVVGSTPIDDVVIDSAELFTDTQNGVLVIAPPHGFEGEFDVTVTVSDGNGDSAEHTFHVTVELDDVDPAANSNPFFDDIDDIHTGVDTPVDFYLPSFDVEDDPLIHEGLLLDQNTNLELEIVAEDGFTTVTPINGVAGVEWIYVSVRPEGSLPLSAANNYNPPQSDVQFVPVFVHPLAPTSIELLDDIGAVAGDGLTNLDNSAGKQLQFRVSGLMDGATVRIFAGGLQIGEVSDVSGGSVDFFTDGVTPLAEGQYDVTAIQSFDDQAVNVGNRDEVVDVESLPSAAIQVTVDTTGPEFTSAPVTDVVQDQPYYYDVETANEATSGVLYSLTTAPAGMAIDELTGEITWQPSSADDPVNPVVVAADDPVGNRTEHALHVVVHPPAPIDVALLAGSDTGTSNSDGLTKLNNTSGNELEFLVTGVIGGATVRVFADGVQIGEAVAASDTVVITDGATLLADGQYDVTAIQSFDDQEVDNGNEIIDVESDPTAAIPITIDTTALEITSTPPTDAIQGQDYYYDVQADGEATSSVVYSLTAAPAGMAIDPLSGEINWLPGIGYAPVNPVVVLATDPAGNETEQAFNVDMDEAPEISYWQYAGGAEDGYRFKFQPKYGGRLTAQALFSHAEGDVDLVLFDGQGAEVGDPSTQTDGERIDLLVNTGETYELLVNGNNAGATVRVVNLVTEGDGDLTIHGTSGNDTFDLVIGASPHHVTVNGITYDDIDPAARAIFIEGDGGNDTATVTSTGDKDDVELSPGHGHLTQQNGSIDSVDIHDVANMTIIGNGGGDEASLFDGPGSDNFIGTTDYGRLHGDGFDNRVEGFARVDAFATDDGIDTADLYDSEFDDSYIAGADEAQLSGNGFHNQANGFENVFGHASVGADTAELHGSPEDDGLLFSPSQASLGGEGFSVDAQNFPTVSVFGNGGDDTGVMYDSSGPDHFLATNGQATFTGEEFSCEVNGFSSLSVYGNKGGQDTAEISAVPGSQDTLIAKPGETTLTGEGPLYRITQFEDLTVHGTTGDDDIARLYDSGGDDSLVASPTAATMSGEGFSIATDGFDVVHGYAAEGGHDTADLTDSPNDDNLMAGPVESVLSNDDFYLRTKYFDQVTVHSTQGDDVARMTGAEGPDTFTATPTRATMEGDGVSDAFRVVAENFGAVYAYATKGDNDTAELHDSDGDDTFLAWPDHATLSLLGNTYSIDVENFDSVLARAPGDGVDVAKLFDSEGDDRLIAYPKDVTLSGEGFENQAQEFDAVHAYGAQGGLDIAKLFDSEGDDRFAAFWDQSVMRGDGFYNRVKYFDAVHGYSHIGGIDEAFLYDSEGNDQFDAWADQAVLHRRGVFYNRAKYFEGVHAIATLGGHDVAYLYDSPEQDIFSAGTTEATLYGPGFYNRAKYFEEVHAQGSNSGSDWAGIYGSMGDDQLTGENDWAQMTDTQRSFLNWVAAFDRVTAYATPRGEDRPAGAADTKSINAIVYDLLLYDDDWLSQ